MAEITDMAEVEDIVWMTNIQDSEGQICYAAALNTFADMIYYHSHCVCSTKDDLSITSGIL